MRDPEAVCGSPGAAIPGGTRDRRDLHRGRARGRRASRGRCALARTHAMRVVSSWNRSRMSKLTRAALPAKLRVVFDDGAGVGFQTPTRPAQGASVAGALVETRSGTKVDGGAVIGRRDRVHVDTVGSTTDIDRCPVHAAIGRGQHGGRAVVDTDEV